MLPLKLVIRGSNPGEVYFFTLANKNKKEGPKGEGRRIKDGGTSKANKRTSWRRRPDHKPTTEDAMATTSFFLEAIARPSSRKGVTEDDIGWMGPFLQVGGVPGRRL